MSTALHELEQAVAARSPIEALVALCRAWRSLPSTRIALVARGLAAQVPGDPVAGSNQDEREATWLSLAAHATPVDVQSLLASPWSKKPKDAVARLEQLRRLGPDPRIVGALLELDTSARYTSAAGGRFWQDVYELLLSWGSVEAATRVKKSVTTQESASAWTTVRASTIFDPLALRWAGQWPVEPELSPPVLRALEALELRLAPRRELLRGLLAAVHETPALESPKLVFADALTEQGDPRGEFIALQFTHAIGELPMGKREHMQRLVAASGVSWFDGLEGQIAPLVVFHQGFVREVRLETRTPDPSIRAWRMVETIDTASLATPLSAFLKHENLARVRSLRSLRGGTLEELARGGDARTFELLEIGLFGSREFTTPTWRTERLRLRGPVDQALWWVLGSPLLPRTKSLQFSLFDGFGRVGAIVAELEKKSPELQTIEFAARPESWPTRWHGSWHLRFTRTKERFSTLTISLGTEVLADLDLALSSIAPKQLSSVTASTVLKRGPVWRETTRAMLERNLHLPLLFEERVGERSQP